ncbi:probable disease resistance protein At4g27220 [Telopea speciosissima]|uniref:probable disease resistance protein At4g27220 n=1 Tax=Telopea speciosissima TaxID=54955 RepID=UPI001CC71ECA|nr:probable disease resistance protein At4g27220 [Telopea speciosissima]
MALATLPNFNIFESTDAARKGIINALEDKKLNFIGVYGMGGVGKTTLMQAMTKELKKERFFDRVVMATVSQNPLLKNIQDEIAESLGFKLEKDSESGRAGFLWQIIQHEKRILIILDDVWEPLILKDVGIPYGDKEDCYVIITTRFLYVCDQMNTQYKVEVKVLLEADAWELFRVSAGDCVDSSELHPVAKIKGMQKEVFNSIKFSYDSLRGDDTQYCFLLCCLFPEDFIIFEDDLLPYVLSEDIFEDIDNMKEARNRLHLVLDTLKQSCLLLNVDGRSVRMHDIIRDVAILIAQEDHGFVVEAGRDLREWPNAGKLTLRTCKRLSLMQNEISKFPAEQLVFSQLMILSLRDNESLREIPDPCFEGMISLKVLDLLNTRIVSIPSSLSRLTELRVLRLNRYKIRYTSSLWEQEEELPASSLDLSLLGSMKKLQILDISHYDFTTLPQEIGGLTNLKSLHLSRNIDMHFSKNIPPELIISPNVLSRLSDLEELHLSHCNISTLPQEVGELTNLKSLDLSGNLRLIIPPKVLSRLSGIEELNLDDSFDEWEVEESENNSKACLSEITSLAGLTKLKLVVSNIECLNSNTISLHAQNLTKFTIGCTYSATRRRSEIEIIKITFLRRNYAARMLFWEITIPKLSNWAEVLLRWTEQLFLEKCGGPKNIYPELSGGSGLNNLRYLHISACNDLEQIMIVEEGEEAVDKVVLPRLRVLDLSSLLNFSTLCGGVSVHDFPVLERLYIYDCTNLRKFPISPSPESTQRPRKIEVEVEERWFNQLEWDEPNDEQRLRQWAESHPTGYTLETPFEYFFRVGGFVGISMNYEAGEINVNELRIQMESLGTLSADVQKLVDDARAQKRGIKEEVTSWLRQVEDTKRGEGVNEQQQQQQWMSLGLRCSFSSCQRSKREGIINALEDKKLNFIGVYGLGGVGKTTLMHAMKTKLKNRGSFDRIGMATVSQNPVLENIQNEIAESLGYNKLEKDSDSGRAELLQQKIQGEK